MSSYLNEFRNFPYHRTVAPPCGLLLWALFGLDKMKLLWNDQFDYIISEYESDKKQPLSIEINYQWSYAYVESLMDAYLENCFYYRGNTVSGFWR